MISEKTNYIFVQRYFWWNYILHKSKLVLREYLGKAIAQRARSSTQKDANANFAEIISCRRKIDVWRIDALFTSVCLFFRKIVEKVVLLCNVQSDGNAKVCQFF